MIEGYIKLKNAIVKQAVEDTESAILTKIKFPYDEKADQMMSDCLQFFESQYFTMLCGIEACCILKVIKSHKESWEEVVLKLDELLSRIKELRENLIPETSEDIDRLWAATQSLTTNYEKDTAAFDPNTENTSEIKNINLLAAKEKLKKLKEELGQLLIEAGAIIESIENNRARRFFKAHYLGGKTIREIAKEAGLTDKTVRNEISKSKTFLEK